MKERISIAVDMDGVLADNLKHYIDYYKQETGILLNAESLHGKREDESLPDKTAVRRYIHTPGFFKSLPVKEGAQEVMKSLYNKFDVFIVSAAMEFPHSLLEKYQWLQEYFPFITWKNIVFCGDKHIINTDYLIDDHIKNLTSFKGKPLLFDAFHNVQETAFHRLKNWSEVNDFFDNLV